MHIYVTWSQVLGDTPESRCFVKMSYGHLRRFALVHMSLHNYTTEQAHVRTAELALAERGSRRAQGG